MNFTAILLTLASTMIGSVGTLLFKKGSGKESLINTSIFFGVIMHVLGTIIFITALKMEQLSVLYPVASLGYVFVCMLSVYFLKEKMNSLKWLGIMTIMLGIVFIGLGS